MTIIEWFNKTLICPMCSAKCDGQIVLNRSVNKVVCINYDDGLDCLLGPRKTKENPRLKSRKKQIKITAG